MITIDRMGSTEAAIEGVLATGNAAYFAGMASRSHRPAATVAAGALALVNAGLAAEAALYLALLPPHGSSIESVASLTTRTVLLAAVAVLSALVVRRGSRR